MSFILDALKKSESERQRQSGPALFEVKVAPPRSRFAIWAAGLGGLLAINLAVVGWMLWRGGSTRTAAAAPPPVAAPTPAMAASTPPTATSTPAMAASTLPPATSTPISAAVSKPAAGAIPAGPSTAGPQAHAVTGAATGSAAPAADAGAERPPSVADDDVSPDDLAPAVEPRHPADSPGVIRETASGLPTYQDVEAQPGASVPSLKLDLHVYSPQPDQRFVFLNMMKLHEGDSLPKGVRVDRITPDGVILSYQGKEFVLQRQ